MGFVFLGLSILSVWVRRDPKIWLNLLFLALIAGMLGGTVSSVGLILLFAWAVLWFFYTDSKNWILFIAIVLASFVFKFHLFPLFEPIAITQKFRIGFDAPMVGLFPLALLVPVAQKLKDWKKAFIGFGYGCIGIGIMALLATLSGATHWQMKAPPLIWMIHNLVFVAIIEEAFYRGFVQNELARFMNNKFLALIFSSVIFTIEHIYWAPNPLILIFVFIASLLYGGVYLLTGKIESAILTHFLLNLIHISFFSYHAM